jgi:DNA polymerase-1
MKYEYIRDYKRAAEVALSLIGQKFSAIDTETTGLDAHVDKVTLVSITDSNRLTYVIDTRDPGIFEPFRAPLEDESIVKIGFNLNFDYRLIKGTFGITMENLMDLFLGELCLTQGLQRSGRDLEAVTIKYLKKDRDKTLQKSFIGHTGEFSEEQLAYAAQDTSDLLDIAKVMTDEIRSKGRLIDTWNIENKCIQAWADISYFGQRINVDAWKKIMADNTEGLAKAKIELDSLFRPVVDELIDGELDMNYGSPDQVVHGLQLLGVKVDGEYIEDTNKKTQKKLMDLPVIKSLNVYRGYETLLKNFGQSWLDKIHPITGMIHPKLNQYGTESGRPSCNQPNVLNVPREKRYREAFIAGKGRLIGTVDYSAAELRILADLSGDKLMVDGFNSGVDFHCFVASMLFKKEVTKKNENAGLRQPTKELNFGIAYGMSPYSLYEKINGNGYKISMEETEELFDKYCGTFHTALQWLRSQGDKATKEFWLQTKTGRLRYWNKPEWPKIYAACEKEFGKNFDKKIANKKYKAQMAAISREAGNMPIQSMNADMTKLAMYKLRKEINARKLDSFICGSIYDEIVTNSAEKDAQEVFELQKTIMVDCANLFLTRVKMEVEGHLAECWTK